jgi:hypothetical protein
VTLCPDGRYGFTCLHNRCNGTDCTKKTWQDFRRHHEQARGQAESGELNKYDHKARAFLDYLIGQRRYPLYHGGRFYLYDGSRYVEEPELDMCIRNFFKAKKLAQSNNVIGNVKPVVQNLAYRAESRYGPLPFYVGTEDFPKTVVPYRNGLLDLDAWLAGEVKLLAHTPNWMSTFCLPHEFNPRAGCPRWRSFLEEIFEGDQARQQLLQEFFGLCLTTDTSKQKALVMAGKRRGGKGTTQHVLQHLVGPANWQAFSLDALVSDFGLSSLVNKTVAFVGEVELTGSKDRSKILERLKGIIGEDPQQVNVKHVPAGPTNYRPGLGRVSGHLAAGLRTGGLTQARH